MSGVAQLTFLLAFGAAWWVVVAAVAVASGWKLARPPLRAAPVEAGRAPATAAA
jgi:hypothetical protein